MTAQPGKRTVAIMVECQPNDRPSPSPGKSPDVRVGDPPLPPGWLARHPWATFVVPLAVFMVAGMFEPLPPGEENGDAGAFRLAPDYHYYPIVYSVRIALTVAAMMLVLPGYRAFRGKISWLSLAVGIVGAVVWIGLCKLQWEAKFLSAIGLEGTIDFGRRSAFNPLEQMGDSPFWAYAFLAVRFLGLAAVVPVIEEFFLRGFAMRLAVDADWWTVPFGKVTAAAVVVGTALPMLMHPGELLAAAVWFSLVTWLMVRTRNIWDCVAAHAATNLILGVYVVSSGDWWLM